MLEENLKQIYAELGYNKDKLLVASKNRTAEQIEILLKYGHRLFGENRVQEATEKWPKLKAKYPDTKLHLIGALQTNKVKLATTIFDVIETLDREKLAKTIKKYKNDMSCYIQINTGEEPQKAGVKPLEFADFLDFCIDECSLNIEGLMCIPPVDEPASLHFALLADMAKKYNIKKLSMGMSGDYKIALKFGTSHIRLGTSIFN